MIDQVLDLSDMLVMREVNPTEMIGRVIVSEDACSARIHVVERIVQPLREAARRRGDDREAQARSIVEENRSVQKPNSGRPVESDPGRWSERPAQFGEFVDDAVEVILDI